jgi:UPF0176 protein
MNKVAAFYQFIRLDQPDAVREELLSVCQSLNLYGSVLLSVEGINGTLAGPPEGIDGFVAALRQETPARPAFGGLELKFSTAGDAHFDRLKIRVKREIVTFGLKLDKTSRLGNYVPPDEWNALIRDPEVVVLDTRNGFEVEMGTFERAVDPGIKSFTQLKTFIDETLGGAKDRKIAMFCTGGIRCEKASAYMVEAGFTEVFQLQGGILRYLEEMPQAQSAWLGDCFVFDQRVALGHGLEIKTPNRHSNFLDSARENIAE